MNIKAFDLCSFKFGDLPMGKLTDLKYTTTKLVYDVRNIIPDEGVEIKLLPAGYEMTPVFPAPPADFLSHVQTALSTVAAKLGLPMNLATCSQGCNFASARVDIDRFRRMQQSSIPCGTPIVPCEWMADRVWTQVRFPRSKKKRIQKKWRKNNRNFRIVETPWPPYMANGTLFCHPRTYLAIKRQLILDGEVFVAGNQIIDLSRITIGAQQ